MEPLTTQIFNGDETRAPALSPEPVTVLPDTAAPAGSALTGGAHAIPFRDLGISGWPRSEH